MEALATTFAATFAQSVGSLYNVAYAAALALWLTELPRDRPRLPLVLAGRFGAALLVVWVCGTVSDVIFPNTITWTILPAVTCGLLFHDWKLPVRLTRIALVCCAWMYSIAYAEVANGYWHGGIELASATSLVYMVVVWAVVLLLEHKAPLTSRSMTLLMVAPVLAVCISGLAGRSILILRSDFGLDEFYRVSTLESVLTCLNGQIAELVVWASILHLVSELSEKDRLLAAQHVNETQLAGLRAYQESSESFHRLRHEVKNQYAYIKLLLEQKQYDRAEEFFGEMSMRANPTFAYVATGNSLVDDIVNLEAGRARAAGVELSCRIAVPAELPFSETELCSVLTNLLDNAIEACAAPGAVDDQGKKTVKLGMVVDQGVLVVTVANPAEQAPRVAPDGHLRTTKADGRRHGYGTQIVRSIAEQNGGVADFSYADGRFTARVMLALGEESS